MLKMCTQYNVLHDPAINTAFIVFRRRCYSFREVFLLPCIVLEMFRIRDCVIGLLLQLNKLFYLNLITRSSRKFILFTPLVVFV